MTRTRAERVARDLTPAQRLVLREMLKGGSAAEIADALDLSIFTVHNHSREIYRSFGVTNRTGVLAPFVVAPKL